MQVGILLEIAAFSNITISVANFSLLYSVLVY